MALSDLQLLGLNGLNGLLMGITNYLQVLGAHPPTRGSKGQELNHLVKIPIAAMYDIFTYIYHKNQPIVGKFTNPRDWMTQNPNHPACQWKSASKSSIIPAFGSASVAIFLRHEKKGGIIQHYGRSKKTTLF